MIQIYLIEKETKKIKDRIWVKNKFINRLDVWAAAFNEMVNRNGKIGPDKEIRVRDENPQELEAIYQ